MTVCVMINVLHGKPLSESDKKAYSDKKTLEEIGFAPDEASKSPISKHKLHIIYNGKTQRIDRDFVKMLGDEYIKINTSIISSLPFIIIFKKRDKYLYNKFDKLTPDTTITIYGTLRHKSTKKKLAYYLIVNDFEIFKNTNIASGEFKREDYIEVSPLEFKLKFPDYINKKVALPLYPKSIINRISPVYQKLAGMKLEEFYMINAVIIKEPSRFIKDGVDIEGLGFDVIAARNNSNITESLLTASDSADFVFYGTLKELKSPTQQKSRPVYCFILDAVKSE
jgi:hypothetical protein